MHVDTFAHLKTPEVLATEIAAGETVDVFAEIAAGRVEMLRPVVTETETGADVRYDVVVRPAGSVAAESETR